MKLAVTMVASGQEIDQISVKGELVGYETGRARSIVESCARSRQISPASAATYCLAGWTNGYLKFAKPGASTEAPEIGRARTKEEFARLVAEKKIKRDDAGKFSRIGAVAKALLSGNPDALDGIGREPLRREAQKRGIETRGVSTEALRDALWDHELDGVDDEADLPAEQKAELDLTRLKVPELRERAKAAKVAGYSKMRKAELVQAIRDSRDPDAPTPTVGEAGAQPKVTGSAGDVAAQLEDLGRRPKSGDEERAAALLEPLSSAQLSEIADSKGWGRFIKGTKAQKRELLVDMFVGSRLQFDSQITGAQSDPGSDSGRRPWDNGPGRLDPGDLSGIVVPPRDNLTPIPRRKRGEPISTGDALAQLTPLEANPTSGDEAAAVDILNRLTMAQLDEVATSRGFGRDVKGTRDDKIDTLAHLLVGSKISLDVHKDSTVGSLDVKPEMQGRFSSRNAPRPSTSNLDVAKAELDRLRANPQRGDRAKVAEILKPMRHKDLDQLAADNGWVLPGKATLPQKRAQLEEHLVGRRLSSDAIFGLKDRPRDPLAGQMREDHDAIMSWRAEDAARFDAAAAEIEVGKSRIREAYERLIRPDQAGDRAPIVSLADLREALSDLPRGQVDAALLQLIREPGINIVPQSNQKTLTGRDRAAMVRIGNEDKLLFSIDRDVRRSATDDDEGQIERHKPGGVDHDQRAHGHRGAKRLIAAPMEAAARLAAGVASGVKAATPLGGGTNALVERVEFNNGTKAVRKKAVDDVQTRFERIIDADNEYGGTLTAKDQQDAEELAAVVARAVGVRVPAMHRVAEDDAYFELIEGKTALTHLAETPSLTLSALHRQYGETDDGIKLGFLDALLNNADRHEGNWMIDGSGKLVGIDHGQTFQPSFGRQDSYGTHDPFSENFSDNAGMWWEDNPMSPEDIVLARERLMALRFDFDRLGRGDWHDAMMRRLDGIGDRAQGTKRRLT